MALGDIPDWIRVNPRDFASAAEAGARLGLERSRMAQAASNQQDQLAIERARLAQQAAAQQDHINMVYRQLDAASRDEEIKRKATQANADRNFLIQNQRNNIAQAYHDTQIGLAKQKLEDVAKQQAMIAAHKQGYVQAVASGVTPAQAASQYPLALTSGILDEISRRPARHPEDFTTITEKYPAVDAIPPTPAQTHWFSPDEPAKPGNPAQLERTVTRRVPVSSSSPIPETGFKADSAALKFIRDASGNLVPEPQSENVSE